MSAKYVRRLNVYGYCVLYRQDPDNEKWTVDQDDEYANLPAHYLSVEEAMDRIEYLRERGIEARVASLLAEDDDEPNNNSNEGDL